MNQQQSSSVAYKCPQCNASLSFNPVTQGFDCEFCGGHFTQEQLESIETASLEELPIGEAQELEQDSAPASDAEGFANDNRLYLCPGCGAAVIAESELSASAICHYCHTPIVMSGRVSGEYCPDMIIPFSKTREDALAGFKQWTAKYKTFLAKGFGSPESLAKIQGIYVPYWLADCVTEGMLVADCFKTVSSVRSGDYIIKTENKYTVVRNGTMKFDRIPADGSRKADDALMESIEPFDYSKLVSFKMAYLAGHNAERYDVSKEQVYPRINERACAETRLQFNNSIKGYTRKVTRSESYRVKGIRWKYVMLPMWFLSYTYKGKMYYYAMNGDTGKFGGTLPLNKLKLALISFGIPVAVGLIIAVIAGFAGGM